jgi:hypothetical protein
MSGRYRMTAPRQQINGLVVRWIVNMPLAVVYGLGSKSWYVYKSFHDPITGSEFAVAGPCDSMRQVLAELERPLNELWMELDI